MLSAGAGLMAGAVLCHPLRADATTGIVQIHMKSNPAGGVVGFDPVGVFLEPGQRVRWIGDANVHTTTAYSPRNENHSLRIPKSAEPWTSNYLLPGEKFELKLEVEGVYDYFCLPHEQAGMVGRLVVGRAVGPGTLPFDYFKGKEHWAAVPEAAQRTFPSIDEILRRKVVPSPLNFSS
jgi:plastocyanin